MDSPQATIAIATIIAIALSEGKSSKELVQMVAILNQVSDTLTNIAVALEEPEIIDINNRDNPVSLI